MSDGDDKLESSSDGYPTEENSDETIPDVWLSENSLDDSFHFTISLKFVFVLI